MDKLREFVAFHPGVIVAFLAAMGAYGAVNAYRIGVAHAQLRAEFGEQARAANARLGG